MLAVGQAHLQVYQRIPCENAPLDGTLDPLFHGPDVLARHLAPDHCVLEHVALSARKWFQVEVDDSELAIAAGLFLLSPFDMLDLAADRLTILDAGWPQAEIEFGAAPQPLELMPARTP